MQISEILAILGGIGTLGGIITAFLAYKSGLKKEGTASGALMSDVGYIKSGVDDLKRKQEQSDTRHYQLSERVTAVEASAKQAHLRIDRIEKNE